MITQSIDDGIVQTLSVHGKDPKLMWEALSADYNTVTPAHQSLARQDFQAFRVIEDESYMEIKQRFNELLRKVGEQNGVISIEDQLQTLLGSLPAKFDILRESYFVQTPAPNITYLWTRMYDIETTQKRREAEMDSTGMRGEAPFETRGRGGISFRGRGRGNSRGGSFSGGRGVEVKNERCFGCGEMDHWSRECPKKETVCNWCGVVGHIEKTCYSKANGAVRGGKTGGRGGGRAGRGGRGGGSTRFGEGDADEESSEQGHSEVLIGGINMGTGEGDGEEREWVCDSGADYHMSGDATLFDSLERIPSKFFVKQIMGRVAVLKWGTVRLLTDGIDGVNKKLELQEVLFMAWKLTSFHFSE